MSDQAVVTADPTIDALKSLLDTNFERINTMVNDRLKAFEDAPALKSAGFVTPDGGDADPGVKNFADFLTAVQRKDEKRLKSIYSTGWQEYGSSAIKALGEQTGSAGGYAVPTTFETQIQQIAALMAFFEPLAYQVPMGGPIHKIPMLNQTDNPTTSGVGGSGFYGGMYFTLDAEGGTIANRQPNFKMLTLEARKLSGLTTSSNELRTDAPAIETELLQLFAQGLAASKQYLFLHFNGVGGPLGALNTANPALMSHTRKSSGNDIEINDVTGMLSKMIPSLSGNAVWVCHPYALDNIMQLQLVTNGDPAFSPASNAAPGSPLLGSLLGKPLYANEYMSLPGTAGDMALVAPNAYAVGTRSGILVAGSEHAYFTSDQYAWRVTTRIDGQPRIDSTMKLADGSNTPVSAFIRLS
jgi:HK97 family phage major capsid protein